MGLAARPGTAVEPICSRRSASSPRARLILSACSRKVSGGANRSIRQRKWTSAQLAEYASLPMASAHRLKFTAVRRVIIARMLPFRQTEWPRSVERDPADLTL